LISRENEDILEAFCSVDGELRTHRARYELAEQIKGAKGKSESLWTQ